MSTARARAASLLTLFLLFALTVTALPAAPSRAAVLSSSLTASTPDPEHPYSDPIWFPLRNPAKVSCVVNNCPGPYHNYWAIDFVGNLDDPIYAPGAGVFHVGKIDSSCPATGNTSGTWVWIDHGMAGATIYEHLNRILAREGQLVTPATEIGTMGHNGNTAPCHPNYLHMEWRAQRLGGTRQPIPMLRACSGSTLISYPSALGYSSWNSMPANQISTGTLTNSCLPTTWATPDRPTFTVARGSSSAVVTPSARPAGATNWMDRFEEYHPSTHTYGLPVYHQHYAGTPSTTVTGLVNGHTYRVSVAFHNAVGWSAWATNAYVVPAAVPSVPRFRGLTHGSTWEALSWYRSSSPSTATYQVARHCYFSGAWHSWVFNTVPGTNLSYVWSPITPQMTCSVTVRAHNSQGWSAFMPTHLVTTS